LGGLSVRQWWWWDGGREWAVGRRVSLWAANKRRIGEESAWHFSSQAARLAHK
jgi:hypothetical protein